MKRPIPPVPEGFIVPAGWALVPLEPDWEVVKAER